MPGPIVYWDALPDRRTKRSHHGRHYHNTICTEECMETVDDGKLQCKCGESGVFQWQWERQQDPSIVLYKRNGDIIFHPVYSSGTAALKGQKPFARNRHHYFEMKMLSNLYGTDVMVGVGTARIVLSDLRFRFFSLLGFDKQSWGYSYNGSVQHNSLSRRYGAKFGMGSLVGVYLDMVAGTLEFYLNRRPQGIAFTGLKGLELYPMVCSTAAQSAMKTTCALSLKPSLQLICLHRIVRDPRLLAEFKSVPGLVSIFERHFFWMLPKDVEETKRRSIVDQYVDGAAKYAKRRKLFLPIRWAHPGQRQFEISLIDSDDDELPT